MGSSLQDQLLKSGLVDERKARQAQAERGRRRKSGPRKGQGGAPEPAARDARGEKRARDRELNARQQAKAARKALVAEVRQLIDAHRVPRDGAEIGYHFQDGDTIRKMYVTPAIQQGLAGGRLEIVRMGGRYDVVPPEIAEKIRARDAAFVVQRTVADAQPDGDDPYADYPVPDDLMW
jgi:hypothetical protein